MTFLEIIIKFKGLPRNFTPKMKHFEKRLGLTPSLGLLKNKCICEFWFIFAILLPPPTRRTLNIPLLIPTLFTKNFVGKKFGGKTSAEEFWTTWAEKISAGKYFSGINFGQHFQ